MNPENNMEDIPTELEIPVTPEVEEPAQEDTPMPVGNTVVPENVVDSNPVMDETPAIPEVPTIDAVLSVDSAVAPALDVSAPTLENSAIIPEVPSATEPSLVEQPAVEIKENNPVVQSEPVLETPSIAPEEPIINNVIAEPQVEISQSNIEVPQPVASEPVPMEPVAEPVIAPQPPIPEPTVAQEINPVASVEPNIETVANPVAEVPVNTPVEPDIPQEPVVPLNNSSEVVLTPSSAPIPEHPVQVSQPEFVPPMNDNVYVANSMNQMAQPQNVNMQITESYNPPESIEIESNQQEAPKKQSNKSTLITIIIVVLILGIGAFIGYRMISNAKKSKVEEKVVPYKYSKLEVKENFEDAYNIKVKELLTEDANDNAKYVVNEGVIEYSANEKTFKLSVANANIQNIALIDTDSKGDYIGFNDDANNYYFATIINISKDTELTKENVNLITISEENNIKYMGVGHYQNREDVFFFVRKAVLSGDGEEETTYDYYVDVAEETTKLFPIKDKVYVGLDIPMNTLDVSDKFLEKVTLDGVGLYYEGNIYLYSGSYDNLKEVELIAKDDKAFKAKEIYVLYSEKENKLDLFIINEEDDGDHLYIVDLLKIEDLDSEEFDINSVESKIKNYSFKTENGKSSVYIEFEDGKNIKY